MTEARRYAERATVLDPAYLEAWVLLSVISVAQGAHVEAERSARQALALNPQEIQAWNTLGDALLGQKKFVDAVGAYEKLLEINPSWARAELMRASALAMAGQVDEAAAGYKRYLASHPDSFEAWQGLGHACHQRKDYAEALASYRRAVALRPDHAQTQNNLGNAYLASGDVSNAEFAFRKALDLAPDLAEAQANLGVVMQGKARYGEARQLYLAALEKMPDNALLHTRLASMLEALGDFAGALAHCDRVATLQASTPEHKAKVARILQKAGEYERAYEILRPDVEAGSAGAVAVAAFANAASHLGDDRLAQACLERALGNDALTERDRQRLHSALGVVHDKAGRYDDAFEHFSRANRLKPGKFDADGHARYISDVVRTYSKEFMRAAPRSTSLDDRPVFIVGMPRSGTSLVEQILASHPAIHGAGELEDVGRLAESLHVQTTAGLRVLGPAALTQPMVSAMAEDYLAMLRSRSPQEAVRVIDKMPHNFFHLGLIELLFPKARIIHVVRNPIDTCLSCFFQEFHEVHAYARNLEWLGIYYRAYETLMQHWEQVVSLPVHRVQYESLVENQEAESRKLIEFCGLQWAPGVLRFHETQRNVATPSYDQVRQPMYRKSLNRWKHYERHIGPLVETLSSGL